MITTTHHLLNQAMIHHAHDRLRTAIVQHDPVGLHQALQDGANLRFNPTFVPLLELLMFPQREAARTFSVDERRVLGSMTHLLLNAGVDPNAHDALGSSALGQAVHHGLTAVVSGLLQRGAHPNRAHRVRSAAGLARPHLPLITAIDTLLPRPLDGLSMVRTLLDQGADVHALDPSSGGNALHRVMRATTSEHRLVVRWLIDAGADPQARNVNGHRALDLASGTMLAEMVVKMGQRATPTGRSIDPMVLDAQRLLRRSTLTP